MNHEKDEMRLRIFILSIALSPVGDLSFSFFWNAKFVLFYPVFGLTGAGVLTILASLSGLYILRKFRKYSKSYIQCNNHRYYKFHYFICCS
jgi:pilus assembly protein TadC